MKLNDLNALVVKLLYFGLEPFGQYYGIYSGEIIDINYPYIDVKMETLSISGKDELYDVPIRGVIGKDNVIKSPISKGDQVLISFIHGKISYPVAEFGYARVGDDDKVIISDKIDRTQTDFFQVVSKDGLEFNETKDGFTLKKGKLILECTEDKILLKNNHGELQLDESFLVSVKKKISLKAGSFMTKAINLSKLVSMINIMKSAVSGHTHIAPPSGGATGPAIDLITPSTQKTIQSSNLSISDVEFQ